jgi:hypothetical protein
VNACRPGHGATARAPGPARAPATVTVTVTRTDSARRRETEARAYEMSRFKIELNFKWSPYYLNLTSSRKAAKFGRHHVTLSFARYRRGRRRRVAASLRPGIDGQPLLCTRRGRGPRGARRRAARGRGGRFGLGAGHGSCHGQGTAGHGASDTGHGNH